MTTNYTQFLNVLMQAFVDNVSDTDTSTWAAKMDQQLRYNVQTKTVQEVTLANAATYTLNAPASLTEWHLYCITCRPATPAAGITQAIAAQGYVTYSGKKFDGTTSITGTVPLYGALLPSGVYVPGIAFFSTYNQSSAPVITSQMNGSIFTIYDAICVEDGG